MGPSDLHPLNNPPHALPVDQARPQEVTSSTESTRVRAEADKVKALNPVHAFFAGLIHSITQSSQAAQKPAETAEEFLAGIKRDLERYKNDIPKLRQLQTDLGRRYLGWDNALDAQKGSLATEISSAITAAIKVQVESKQGKERIEFLSYLLGENADQLKSPEDYHAFRKMIDGRNPVSSLRHAKGMLLEAIDKMVDELKTKENIGPNAKGLGQLWAKIRSAPEDRAKVEECYKDVLEKLVKSQDPDLLKAVTEFIRHSENPDILAIGLDLSGTKVTSKQAQEIKMRFSQLKTPTSAEELKKSVEFFKTFKHPLSKTYQAVFLRRLIGVDAYALRERYYTYDKEGDRINLREKTDPIDELIRLSKRGPAAPLEKIWDDLKITVKITVKPGDQVPIRLSEAIRTLIALQTQMPQPVRPEAQPVRTERTEAERRVVPKPQSASLDPADRKAWDACWPKVSRLIEAVGLKGESLGGNILRTLEEFLTGDTAYLPHIILILKRMEEQGRFIPGSAESLKKIILACLTYDIDKKTGRLIRKTFSNAQRKIIFRILAEISKAQSSTNSKMSIVAQSGNTEFTELLSTASKDVQALFALDDLSMEKVLNQKERIFGSSDLRMIRTLLAKVDSLEAIVKSQQNGLQVERAAVRKIDLQKSSATFTHQKTKDTAYTEEAITFGRSTVKIATRPRMAHAEPKDVAQFIHHQLANNLDKVVNDSTLILQEILDGKNGPFENILQNCKKIVFVAAGTSKCFTIARDGTVFLPPTGKYKKGDSLDLSIYGSTSIRGNTSEQINAAAFFVADAQSKVVFSIVSDNVRVRQDFLSRVAMEHAREQRIGKKETKKLIGEFQKFISRTTDTSHFNRITSPSLQMRAQRVTQTPGIVFGPGARIRNITELKK